MVIMPRDTERCSDRHRSGEGCYYSGSGRPLQVGLRQRVERLTERDMVETRA